MSLFSWKGDIDTILSPRDSIRYNKFFIHSGMMSMDPKTGHVKAYVGGIDYRFFKYDHVKVGRRQVGSTFKPFLVFMLTLAATLLATCIFIVGV